MRASYRHEALLYEGQQAFLSCCSAVADQAAQHSEQLMVVVSGAKLDTLRGTLGSDFGEITYIDADEQVRNPARLLTLLDDARSAGQERRCVSIHEPVLDGTPATLAETRLAENVLNSPALQSWNFAVLCMYDTTRLDPAAAAEMRRSHPAVRGEDGNPAYEPELADTLFGERLPDPPASARGHEVRTGQLAPAREFVRNNAGTLAADRREDLVLAADEVVTNSIRYGGGRCRMTMWDEAGTVVCDVRDPGHIKDPMAGRLAPRAESTVGRGLWLVNHLCDLVQVRSSQAGTTVRLRVHG